MSRRPTLAQCIAIAGVALPMLLAARPLTAQTVTTPAPIDPPAVAAVTFEASDSKACLRCHGMPNLGYRETAGADPRRLTVHADSFASGAHRRLSCQSCHPDVRTWPHQKTPLRRTVSCADDCHATDSLGKPYTHRAVVETFAASAHGRGLDEASRRALGLATGALAHDPGARDSRDSRGTRNSRGARDSRDARNPDAPTCLSCHGGDAHALRPARDSIAIGERMAMCVTCHDDEARMRRNGVATNAVASYRRSFHYKAIRFGETNTAVCQDCHTTHGVLPADSARSSVAQGNVATTCGRSDCHPGAKMNFAMSGANHLDLRIERSTILWFEESFFLLLTGGTMAMLLVGIVLDIQRRFGWRTLLKRWSAAVARALATATRTTVRIARTLLID